MHPSPAQLPAFDALVRVHSPALLRQLRHRVGNAATAEDLLQETLIKAAQGLHAFDARCSFKTWLHSIARNVAADHLRAAKRGGIFVGLDAAADVIATGPSPEEQIDTETMRRCVRRILDTLPRRDRTAISLHDLAGLSSADTAQALGVSVGAARVGVHRARGRLEAALNRHCEIRRDGASALYCAPRACPEATH